MGLLARQPLVALFTVVEVVGLGAWLAIVEGMVAIDPAARLGIAIPTAAVGLGVLLVALFVEHLLTDAAVNGVRLDVPLLPALVFSVTETALWGLWLAVADAVGGLTGVAAAGVLLAVLLVPQHTIEDNALRGRGLLSTVLDAGTIGFSVVEALGASLWLALIVRGSLLGEVAVAPPADPALVGLAILAVLLFVEHNVGVRFALRVEPARPRRTADARSARG